MPIVSSGYTEGNPQVDGRRWVFERHTDHVGVTHLRRYLAEITDDIAAILAARAALIVSELREREITSNALDIVANGSLATPSVNYSTLAQNGTALRTIYATATDRQAVMVGDYLNTLTNAQIAAAFGITTGQAATLRTNKLAPAATAATSLRATAGA